MYNNFMPNEETANISASSKNVRQNQLNFNETQASSQLDNFPLNSTVGTQVLNKHLAYRNSGANIQSQKRPTSLIEKLKPAKLSR